MNVSDVMTTEVISIAPETTFREIVDLLATDHLGCLPVLDSLGGLLGIVTESDLLAKEAFGGQSRTLLGVHDGIVTLRGAVRFSSDLPEVLNMLWRIPGMVDVRTEVRALEPDPTILPV